MGPWSEHGNAWYTCNRFDEKDSVDARDTQSKSRASLERYLFVGRTYVYFYSYLRLFQYYNRYANHEQSAKLSLDLYAKTERKMEEMQVTSDLTWIEVQFAKKAVDEVIKCRNTLQWTYAMAYYLVRNQAVALFRRLLNTLCLLGERYIPTHSDVQYELILAT
jgi:ariadne-1